MDGAGDDEVVLAARRVSVTDWNFLGDFHDRCKVASELACRQRNMKAIGWLALTILTIPQYPRVVPQYSIGGSIGGSITCRTFAEAGDPEQAGAKTSASDPRFHMPRLGAGIVLKDSTQV